MAACGMGRREVVDLLLQAGADVNKKHVNSDDGDSGETILMDTAGQGYQDLVEKLLKHGADIRAKTRRGRSPLTFAMDRDPIDQNLVRLLLDNGCPVDGRDLHRAVEERDLVIVERLLAARPEINARFDWPKGMSFSIERGDTPLHVGVSKSAGEIIGFANMVKPRADRLEILERLISAGADVNAQQGMKGNGWTPLMIAIAQDEDDIARLLLDAGADLNKTIECKQVTVLNGCQKLSKGPLSPLGMVQEQTQCKKVRQLLLGHE